MSGRRLDLAVLVLLGLGWGFTQPTGKMATATGHGPFGLIFWQLVICVLVLGAITRLRGRGLMLTRPALTFAVVVAVLGTLVPNATFYISVARLPSAVMSILISTIPMMAFGIAMLLGADRFSLRRVAGLGLGLAGVVLLAAPGAGVWAAGLVAFLPLALVGPLFYAMESNYVARVGMAGMDAVQAMFMASLVGMVLCLPLALASGQMFNPLADFGRPELALIASSVVHGLCYAGYVWLAARAGAVFAAQCSYLVTGAGVLWAVVLLGEQLQPQALVSLVLMLAGVALVKPREAVRANAV
ncbi:DMT family transporter [Pseudotabrizicola sp. L79]|uniref:DMT family transporter n=1 Tax=Pseudotabrizicola sp. L79 TaxID=3118402 RepID=UPI002F949003